MPADVSATGIVLRRFDSGESDRRLIVLTSEFGKISLVAKGARKSSSRLAGSTDLLSLARFTWAQTRQQRYITAVQPSRGFPFLRTDYDKLAVALAWCELVDVAIPQESPDPAAYELTLQLLNSLENGNPAASMAWAMAHLLNNEGVYPNWTECQVSHRVLKEEFISVSPHARGAIADEFAIQYSDSWTTTWESLVGLKKIIELEEPPAKMKNAEEAVRTLSRFWMGVLERPLASHQALINLWDTADV